ncbi:MAG: Gfo/Idh/MocA family oxidoreductase [Proteobacteria bacterium]|nr:Gfo/Idh/MocA family oxidoreductase [Pseudomonadota bacterium]
MKKINLLIIGNGHYATGLTAISGQKQTDKDLGVFFPSALALRSEGFVNQIAIAGRDGSKYGLIEERCKHLRDEFGWETGIKFYPADGVVDEKAYIHALEEMPRPCAALIAVPDALHKQVILECIKNEMPFLVVKPAVIALKDLYEILDAMEGKSVFGMVDYHKVFDEANLLLKQEYEKGEFGKIQHIYSLMSQRRDMIAVYKRWLEAFPDLNINHYLGSHYIQLTGYLTKAEPIDVRSTAQYGFVREITGKNIADLIETQIRWRDPSGHLFISYHVAGWADPSETESMTYQEIHLMCENGHVDSDQRYRGYKTVLTGNGSQIQNPYFFSLVKNPLGHVNLGSQYGYLSVKTFVQSALDVIIGRSRIEDFDRALPTIRESERVTSILEAADISLKNGSAVVKIIKKNGRYQCCPVIN